jgi:hypothetical protein
MGMVAMPLHRELPNVRLVDAERAPHRAFIARLLDTDPRSCRSEGCIGGGGGAPCR